MPCHNGDGCTPTTSVGGSGRFRKSAEANSIHQKGFDQLSALATAVKTLAPGRLRYVPPVPQSGMTHVHLRGDLATLTAAGAALQESTGISLFRG